MQQLLPPSLFVLGSVGGYSTSLPFVGGQPGPLVKEERLRIWTPEVEHVVQHAGALIERALPDPLPAEPVVFDEAKDRALVGHRVIDKVLLRVGRDHQQRQTRTIAAASLCM